ncbi:hypothetical protein PVAND_014599 [Polypedilum vanderplanki]|uniref:Uncharacterized protein n=1 Tax=Polypedilum vanderplanki TaxID=319348 RepID=A0A9J6BA69_POLVA|nr:hypothetical protein PVAND_014599 [Polypedilum vanderplanki]
MKFMKYSCNCGHTLPRCYQDGDMCHCTSCHKNFHPHQALLFQNYQNVKQFRCSTCLNQQYSTRIKLEKSESYTDGCHKISTFLSVFGIIFVLIIGVTKLFS